MNDIIFENRHFKLSVGEDCLVKSLIYKPTGEECAAADEEISLFSVTQPRPFHNEIKLAYMNKRTKYEGASLVREGNILTVGFGILPYDAKIEVEEKEDYISFTLKEFVVHENGYGLTKLRMNMPPISEFRLLQLPLKHREAFGEWLNVVSGGGITIGVMATSPCERIDSEKRKYTRILTADASTDIKTIGARAVLAVRKTEEFLDSVEAIEEDYDLPRGVKSRRSDYINRSAYWVGSVSPEDIDEHIAFAKKGGFKMMLFYYSSMVKEKNSWALNGNYDLKDCFTNGYDDIKAIIAKVNAAGMKAGIHFLHTHIGMDSRYATPVPDHRLGIKKYFTLARDIGENDTTIYVDEDTVGSALYDNTRVLMFGKELIYYESFSRERPFRFEGCTRGYNGTTALSHKAGEIGGILDISEYGIGRSVYVDQNSDLQEEIAEKIAALYDLGFEFVYMDGSEGTNLPYEYHIPNAQYRVYKKLKNPPLYCEGAAKAHFSWHMLSGGNAFDVFPTDIFKDSITKFPFDEAAMMKDNFTRVNFGWWAFFDNTRPDVYEFGTSRAAAWDSPVTVMGGDMVRMKRHPRTDDILEVIRRWEDVRAKKWLTEEQKEMLKDTSREYTLLINEAGEYELTPYKQIALPTDDVTAFVFERDSKPGRSYVVLWDNKGDGSLTLGGELPDAAYEREIGGEKLSVCSEKGTTVISVGARAYLSASLSPDKLEELFKGAKLN